MTNSEKIVSLMKSLEILKGKKIQLEKEVSLNQEMLLSNAGKSEAKAYAEALMVAETEYKATLQAIARNEELLNAQVKLENSQEFKNKVAEVHKTKADCLKRTSEVADRLQSLNEEIEAIFEAVKALERLGRETGAYAGGRQSQPFAWLGLTKLDLSKRLRDWKAIKGTNS